MAADNRDLEQIFDPRFSRSMTCAQRIHLAMTRMDYVQKDDKAGMKYSIVSHDKVTALVRSHTVACGIIYYPLHDSITFKVDGNRAELTLAVRFESIDNADDFKDVLGIGFGIDPGDKGPGKAISYAVKYALLKAFGLETGDDPDQDQDVQHRSTTQKRGEELICSVSWITAPADLITLLQDPSTEAISQGLRRDAPADWRVLNQTVTKKAKEVGVDLKTLTVIADRDGTGNAGKD